MVHLKLHDSHTNSRHVDFSWWIKLRQRKWSISKFKVHARHAKKGRLYKSKLLSVPEEDFFLVEWVGANCEESEWVSIARSRPRSTFRDYLMQLHQGKWDNRQHIRTWGSPFIFKSARSDGDISPDSCFLTSRNGFVLRNFGLARRLRGRSELSNVDLEHEVDCVPTFSREWVPWWSAGGWVNGPLLDRYTCWYNELSL